MCHGVHFNLIKSAIKLIEISYIYYTGNNERKHYAGITDVKARDLGWKLLSGSLQKGNDLADELMKQAKTTKNTFL